jgi:hypothetical protein
MSDEEDGDQQHEDEEDDCPYAVVNQLFSYRRYEYRDGKWIFMDCELNETIEPLRPGFHVDIILVDFRTGQVILMPSLSDTETTYDHQLILSTIPLEPYERDDEEKKEDTL